MVLANLRDRFRSAVRAATAIAYSALCIVAAATCVSGCGERSRSFAPREPSLVINLRWIKGYSGQSRSEVETGLYWTLSFLGAGLPSDAGILSWRDNVVAVDLDAAAVPEGTRAAWIKILNTLKSTEEYKTTNGIDIGRFSMLTLGSSHHYFALTGVSERFADFLAKHTLDSKQVAIVESAIARGNRLIELEAGATLGTIAFVAYEGTGSLTDNSFRKAEIETLDLMPNGQLRFGLYDLEGHLKPATTQQLTTAGKPGKCLWCHEINLQQPFNNVTDVSGYHTTREFRDAIAASMRVATEYRYQLASKVNFRHLDDHSYAEYLYQTFAEPTAARLALEWNLPLDRVSQRLEGLKPHANKELAFLGGEYADTKLYYRSEVDAVAPFGVERVPTDTREPSAYEPNLLR